MSKEKTIREIDIDSLDAELSAAKAVEESKNTVFGRIATVIAFAMAVFHLYMVWGRMGIIPFRGIHVAFAFSLIFLTMPLYEHLGKKGTVVKNKGVRIACRIVDILVVLALWTAIYLASYEYNHLADQLGIMTWRATVAGAILLIVVLEGTRRILGLIMPVLAIIFLLYGLYGHLLSGRLQHKRYPLKSLLQYLSVDLDGIFGNTISVSAATIFMFVMFGAFLEASGCSQFINDLALSLTGKLRCGPALAAVVASALMGCINGSAVANVVGTGTFTIPLMKSRGYRPEFASGVEAVASTGGQILPPVMGSGAFLMVIFTAVSYANIVKAAVIPAVLYFLGAGIAVYAQGEVGDVELLPKDQIPKTRNVLKRGWMYLLIIAVLIFFLLVVMVQPQRAAFWAVVSVPVVMLLDREHRFKITDIPKSMVKSSFSALSVVAGCACAGIVVAMVARTGLGGVFGDFMIGLAGGNLFLTLVFAALACIVLGMGLPTTSAYVIGASILAPALAKLDLPLLTAHLFVFYFACLSAITPPVALAAYAGAGIAKCNPMKTAVNACMIGFAGFIVPFVFCYNSAMMLDGPFLQVLQVVLTSLLGCIGMSCGMQGWYFSRQDKISFIERILLVGGGLCMMIPGTTTDIIGIVVLAGLFVFEKIRYGKKTNAAAA